MEGTNWDAYFPMPNNRNIERLQYSLSVERWLLREKGKAETALLVNNFNYILKTIGEELLCNCIYVHITSAMKIKLIWEFPRDKSCQVWILPEEKVRFTIRDIHYNQGLIEIISTNSYSLDNLLEIIKEKLKLLIDGES